MIKPVQLEIFSETHRNALLQICNTRFNPYLLTPPVQPAGSLAHGNASALFLLPQLANQLQRLGLWKSFCQPSQKSGGIRVCMLAFGNTGKVING
jgi:hypothetical protein